jgi:hypothetical protein
MNAIEAALRYLRAGFAPIPLPRASKNPGRNGWPDERHTEESVGRFDPTSNIGVLNGEPSGGLIDVDLDAPEAVAVAALFLSPTPLVFGRPGKWRSHWLYRCIPTPPTTKFTAPQDPATKRADMLVEVLSTGSQTVWPPSIHPSGEAIAFEGEPRTPAVVPGARLVEAARSIAVTALLARVWPREVGVRHQLALAAAGYLLRRGVPVNVVQTIVGAAAREAGDEETRDRMRDVLTTAQRLARGGQATGGIRLAELVGAPVLEKLSSWFGSDTFRTGETFTDTGSSFENDIWSKAVTAAEFLAGDDPALDWLIPRVLSQGSLTNFFSPRGLGKTHVAYAYAIELARRGHAVLLLDRDNAKREIRRRLRAWGAADLTTLKVLTRDDTPPLTDAVAWRTFPFETYALLIIDSLDASTEGVGEQDSAKPAKAIAPLLDIAHRADGPAILVLGNTIKSGSHGRGSGVIEDRGDIALEIRDATGFQPSGTKPWWTELPAAGRDAWAERAVRRTKRERYVLAFVPSKFRVGEEPEPFALEINLGTEPWSLREVTGELDAAGEAARAQAAAERAEAEQGYVDCLAAEVTRRDRLKAEPLALGEAVAVLKDAGAPRDRARALLDEHDGRSWRMVKDVTRRGHPRFVIGVDQRWPPEKKPESEKRASRDGAEDLFSGPCGTRAGDKGDAETVAGEEVPNNGSSPAPAADSPGTDGNGAARVRLTCVTCGSLECLGCDREPGADDGPVLACADCGAPAEAGLAGSQGEHWCARCFDRRTA